MAKETVLVSNVGDEPDSKGSDYSVTTLKQNDGDTLKINTQSVLLK